MEMRKRIIIEVILPPNMDIEHWHRGIVPVIHNNFTGVVYIATEDAKEPDVISGYRDRSR
jgi:hypothetical protein